MKKELLFLLLTTILQCLYAQDETASIIIDAKNELQTWLAKIPPGSEVNYGFNNRDEFSQAITGKQYQVFSLNKQFFKEELNDETNYLEPTGEWRIPIVVNQENRALITLMKLHDKWEIVDLGARVLARELQILDQKSPFIDTPVISFLRIYQLNSDFLFIEKPELLASELKIYPLQSAYINISELSTMPDDSITLSKLLPVIQNTINKYNR